MRSSSYSAVLLLGYSTIASAGPVSSATALHGGAHESKHWGYEGVAGPSHWSEWGPSCGAGREQSPVDISRAQGRTLQSVIPPLVFKYRASHLKEVNNGHTLQANLDRGSLFRVGNQSFDLVQFHFHTPSEHRIDGQEAEMEAHLVHQDRKGKLAVVGVMIRAGRPNAFMETLWSHMPDQVGIEQESEGVWINAQNLLPLTHEYWTYPGSLTTPPCSEGVLWHVMKSPIEASPQQIAQFRKWFATNARPPQPLYQRAILSR